MSFVHFQLTDYGPSITGKNHIILLCSSLSKRWSSEQSISSFCLWRFDKSPLLFEPILFVEEMISNCQVSKVYHPSVCEDSIRALCCLNRSSLSKRWYLIVKWAKYILILERYLCACFSVLCSVLNYFRVRLCVQCLLIAHLFRVRKASVYYLTCVPLHT